MNSNKETLELVPPKRLPKRGYGTEGRKIDLLTNNFRVTFNNPDHIVYHYDVSIKNNYGTGEKDIPKGLKMKVFEELKKSESIFKNKVIGFDRMKNACSIYDFTELHEEKIFRVHLKSEFATRNGQNSKKKGKKKCKGSPTTMFSIKMVKVGKFPLKELIDACKLSSGKEIPSTAIQMLSVMVHHTYAVKYNQVSNCSFFSIEEPFARITNIGMCKLGVMGAFAALRPAALDGGSLLMNVDLTHKAFYDEKPVIDLLISEGINEYHFNGPFSDSIKDKVEKSLKGVKVILTHLSYKPKKNIIGVTDKGADKTIFEITPGEKITVQKYMEDKYITTLKYPSVNCLQVGNSQMKTYIPIEFCKVVRGQKVKKPLKEDEAKELIRMASIPPADHLSKIREITAKLEFNKNPIMQALELSISSELVETKGRVLDPPQLAMKNRMSEQWVFEPRDGVWNIADKKFYKGASLEKWAVINYDKKDMTEKTVSEFLDQMKQKGNEMGMQIVKPFVHHPQNPKPFEDFRRCKEKNPDIELIFCIISGNSLYATIKQAGDVEVGILTQCIKGNTVKKAKYKQQIIVNLLMQMNAKRQGVNTIIKGKVVNFTVPFMIMGADVTHPGSRRDNNSPSFAAVVGSYNPSATLYAVETRPQDCRLEIIKDLTEITMNLIKDFEVINKVRPKKIIMYRDGVSDTQFAEVLNKEMLAIKKACSLLQKDGLYNPTISYVCVQKRHHTRLYCKYEGKDGVGKNKNVPPGTIVDRDITHKDHVDFYLCSHLGIQGTSKPAHYHLLWDENDIPINMLEALTYRLCHLYSRCPRSVSIPAPVYYADLAAYRRRTLMSEDRPSMKGVNEKLSKTLHYL